MRFICSGWGRARSATGWFYSASLGHRIHRTAFAKELKGHRDEDGTVRVSSVETMHERRYTVDDWRYDTAHREQTENGQKG